MNISISQLVVTLVALGIISAIFFNHPQGYDREVVRSYEAPSGYLDASKNEPIIISFTYPERPISGILLHAADAGTAGAPLDSKVIDTTGRIVAKKISQHTTYPRSGSPSVSIMMDVWEPDDTKKDLRLVITPQKDETVSFVANVPENASLKPLLVFATLHAVPPTFAIRQGVLIGTALALFLVLLFLLQTSKRSTQWVVAAIGICVCSLLASLPYIYRISPLGINDWDYRYSLAHIYQKTIQTYREFPLWNPYICGGTAALGDPEFSLFTPSFFLQALFGIEDGTGYAIVLCLSITGVGVLVLARSLGLLPLPGAVSAIVVLFSSALFLKTTEGHVTIIFAFMWVPWIWWAWRLKKIVLCAMFLTLAMLQGGIYIVSYTAISLIGSVIVSSNKKEAVRRLLYTALLAIGLSSFQLIPTLYWLKEYPDKAFVGSAYTYGALSEILFGRYVDHTFIIKNQISDWHEYGAYVGYGVAALVLVGVSCVFTRKAVRILALGMVGMLIVSALGPLFENILWYVPYLPRSNISRLILFSLLCAALLAGFGMKRLLSVFRSMPVIPLVLAGFICIDLISLAYPIANQGFVLSRVEEPLPHASYPISHVSEIHTARHQGLDMPRAYEATLQGYGTFSFCSVIGPQSAVVVETAQNPHPAYIISDLPVDVRLVHWSPNSITIEKTGGEPSIITLNANYAPGWRVTGATILRDRKLLTIQVAADSHTVRLTYIPPGMIVGICITAITLVYVLKKLRVVQKVLSRLGIGKRERD